MKPSFPKDQEKESFLHESVEACSLDACLSEKVKIGKYQYKTLFASCLIAMGGGANLLFIGLLLPLLMSNWSISREEQAVLGSIIFGSFGLGAISSSFISQLLGRRRPLILALILQLVFELVSFFMPSFASFSSVRAAHGFFSGVSIPISMQIVWEIMPSRDRHRTLLLIKLSHNVGVLLLTGFLFAFLDDLGDNKGMIWRFLILVCCFPTGIACLVSYHFLKESPYYYLLVDNINDRGFEMLDEMIKENSGFKKHLETQDKLALLKWCQNELKSRSVAEIIKKKQKKMSRLVLLSMIALWFVNSLGFNGIIYAVPTILKEVQLQDPGQISFGTTILFLIFLSSFLIGSNILIYFFSDSNKIGTKSLLISSYLLALASCLTAGLLRNWLSPLIAIIALFFFNITLTETRSLTLFISEHHPKTTFLSELFSSVGAFVMPWAVYLGLQELPAGMMHGFSIASLFALIASILIPSSI